MYQKNMQSTKVEAKREQEKDTIRIMVEMYCRGNHKAQLKALREKMDHPICQCPTCKSIYDYAMEKIERCPMMETKSFCSACKIHCYQQDMRENIKKVMRYSGPRMLFVHPMMAIRHMRLTIQEKRETKRRNKRDGKEKNK